jgi:nucleoside-diphosphate-sugar epimerase
VIAAVTGATGYVGRFVVDELLRQGVRVKALARAGSNQEGFAAPIQWVEGDLRSDFGELVRGVDTVIHLAYEHVPGKYRGGEGDDLGGWLDANVNGSLRLLTAARDAGVQQFVFLSSRAVFSRTEAGRALDETHPVSPDTHYGAYKSAIEAFLASFASVHRMKTHAVRATGVYGLTYPPERSKWWGLIQQVVRGESVASSRGGTEVHGTDVAKAIYRLLITPDAPPILHLSDLYVTHREIVRLAQRFAGTEGTLPPLPDQLPENVMVSRHLKALGIELGGMALLERTIEAIVRAQTIT